MWLRLVTCYTLVSCSADFRPWKWSCSSKTSAHIGLHSAISPNMATFIVNDVLPINRIKPHENILPRSSSYWYEPQLSGTTIHSYIAVPWRELACYGWTRLHTARKNLTAFKQCDIRFIDIWLQALNGKKVKLGLVHHRYHQTVMKQQLQSVLQSSWNKWPRLGNESLAWTVYLDPTLINKGDELNFTRIF
jgi:hypothetical protein